MGTFTWTTTAGGDWTSAADWKPATVPDDTSAMVTLPGVAAVGGYTVTTLGDLSGGHTGPTLDVAGTLSFGGAGALADFFRGELHIESTRWLEGSGQLPSSFGIGTGFDFTNSGTVLADTGSFSFDASDGLVSNL